MELPTASPMSYIFSSHSSALLDLSQNGQCPLPFRDKGQLYMKEKSQRVVVTGLGPISAVGIGKDAFWKALLEGKSGIDRISGFDPSGLTCQIGAEVKDFDAKPYFKDRKSAVRNDRVTLMGVAASRIAVDDAKLDLSSVEGERFGVVVGSAFGGLQTLETQIQTMNEKGPGSVSPFAVPSLLSNLISGVIALENGAKGEESDRTRP